ncbi:MAG: hypothetical protein GOP50_05415 [Candidatus Heimdallarchaeota archaeon]|nr:hypothetical protein [Candidatus Heimdallarchaeota archaeon]
MKISIVGDYASQSFLIGKELEKRGYKLEYFFQHNKFTDLPAKYHKLGSVQGPLIWNYMYTGFWMTLGRLFKKADIQIVNGTYPKCVRTRNTCYSYHGSDLRLGTVKPKFPSFVSLKELQDYNQISIFLPRIVDESKFFPSEEIKENKQKFKDENGIDFIVGHFAHSPHIKGSDILQKAIDDLTKNESTNIHYLNEPVPREKMFETLNFCDFVLDHANPKTGKTYNVISIESLLCETLAASYYETDYIDFPEMQDVIHYINPDPELINGSLLNTFYSSRKIDRQKVLKFHGVKVAVDTLEKYWKIWEFID